MRKINKQTPMLDFNGSKFGNNCSNWDDFHKSHKDVYYKMREKILQNEQDNLEGYTELYVDEKNKDSKDYHIDHYKKRDQNPLLTFEWNNLIFAVHDSSFGADYKDLKYKIKNHEYALIFNPVTDNVEDYFYYNYWGKIEPKENISLQDKGKVIKTIEVFNLNHDSLVERRKNLLKLIQDYKEYQLSKDDILSVLATSGFRSLVEQELI